MDLQVYFDDFTERDWQVTDADAGPVRIAMVGLGWWVREEAIPAVAAADRCETTVVVSRDNSDAEAVADDVETVTVGLSAEEFHDGVATDTYDAVYVCTPNATHLPYVESAADREKPMEATVERAERLVEATGAADVPLMVAYRMQTEPAVRRLRELVRDGLLGDVVACHGHMAQPLLELVPDPDQWRLDPDLAGPGASVTDIGLYPLNTTRFVLESDPVAAQAAVDSTGEAFAAVPDERAAVTLVFPGGVYAACTASQNAAQSSHLVVVGTDGTARLEPAFFPDQPRRLRVTRSTTTVETTFDQVDQMREEFEHFADCLLADRQPPADGRHALVDMYALEAIYEAAEREARVAVESAG
jgi:xylose dehydrogenase (NAD/NADP)